MNIERALKIRGWMSEKELEWLAGMASQSKYIIEVGCYEGRSTRALADNTTGIIFAVDPWNVPMLDANGNQFTKSDDNTRHIFYTNLYDKIKDATVIMFPSEFHKYNFNAFNPVDCDLIFIDGAHNYESVVRDIKHAIKLGPKIIAGHDYALPWTEVIKAVNEYFPNAEKEDTIWYQKLR